MQKSNTLSAIFKLLTALFPFTDFLYILQLEEYSTERLLKWLPRFFFRRNIQIREQLILTKRALITLAVSVVLWVADFLVLGYLLRENLIWLSILTLIFLIAIPLYVLVANFLFSLYEELPKRKIREMATKKLRANTALQVVTVAGSYGKTTVKNFIYQLVRFSYKTQMIPGNINTPGGIANWILRNLQRDTELLISEVDAYEIGEIAKSCKMLRPDIAVLTNIGDQHLERFGEESALGTALSEVFQFANSGALLLTTASTKDKISTELRDNLNIKTLTKNTSLTYQGLPLKVPSLSQTNLLNLQFALAVAEELKITPSFVEDTLTKLELPERRQHVGTILGYTGIDDSYNISFTTAKAGITAAKSLATAEKKKLLVITAGIPELSKQNADKNRLLGRYLDEHADHTIILGSMFANEIAKGFTIQEHFTLVPTLQEFIRTNAQNFKNAEWILLLQPELNDLYY